MLVDAQGDEMVAGSEWGLTWLRCASSQQFLIQSDCGIV
jgi:hypothetical protein